MNTLINLIVTQRLLYLPSLEKVKLHDQDKYEKTLKNTLFATKFWLSELRCLLFLIINLCSVKFNSFLKYSCGSKLIFE